MPKEGESKPDMPAEQIQQSMEVARNITIALNALMDFVKANPGVNNIGLPYGEMIMGNGKHYQFQILMMAEKEMWLSKTGITEFKVPENNNSE